MEHLEAQSYIMPFIDGKVPESKQAGFVLHMKNCPKCHEELEIYYTLMVGMRQLDRRENLSTDFNRDLEEELDRMSHRVRVKQSFRLSAFSVTVAAITVLGAFVYAGGLARLYSFEQRTKERNQGDYYFAGSLSESLLYDPYDRVEESLQIEEMGKITDFDRIHGYLRMEEDLEHTLSVGEGLIDVEASAD